MVAFSLSHTHNFRPPGRLSRHDYHTRTRMALGGSPRAGPDLCLRRRTPRGRPRRPRCASPPQRLSPLASTASSCPGRSGSTISAGYLRRFVGPESASTPNRSGEAPSFRLATGLGGHAYFSCGCATGSHRRAQLVLAQVGLDFDADSPLHFDQSCSAPQNLRTCQYERLLRRSHPAVTGWAATLLTAFLASGRSVGRITPAPPVTVWVHTNPPVRGALCSQHHRLAYCSARSASRTHLAHAATRRRRPTLCARSRRMSTRPRTHWRVPAVFGKEDSRRCRMPARCARPSGEGQGA